MIKINGNIIEFARVTVDLSEYSQQEKDQKIQEVIAWSKENDQELIFAGN